MTNRSTPQQNSTDPKADPSPAVTVEGETFPSAPRAIEYLDVEIPAIGALTEVAPGIFWLRIPMPMDLNHINLWLLEDGDGWTLVDGGLNAEMSREAWIALERLAFAERKLKRIFVTHFHPDHVGLVRWLQERHGASVWTSARTLEVVTTFCAVPSDEEVAQAESFMRAQGYADAAHLQRFFSGKMYRSSVSGVPAVEQFTRDGDSLKIGEHNWRIYETNGHAEGHHCLHDAARNILISGDQVLPTISSNVSFSPRTTDQNPLGSYLDSLARLGELDAHTLVLPSHGKPFFGLRARANDLITHHREHLDAMKGACVEPRTAFDLVPTLFKRRLVGAHWLFAMGETIAHAEYLRIAGELERRNDADGMVRYVRAASR